AGRRILRADVGNRGFQPSGTVCCAASTRTVKHHSSVTNPTDIRACVFDAYGTIFDFASAAARCPDLPERQRAALTSMWCDKQLQYTWLRTLKARYLDFGQVPGDALKFALDI